MAQQTDAADDRTEEPIECPRCHEAGRVVLAGKESHNCEDCGIFFVPEDWPQISSLGFDFYRGDEVRVDWTEGMGATDTFTGIVEDIIVSAGEIIVGVTDYDADGYGDAGKTYDCAPEWVLEVLE